MKYTYICTYIVIIIINILLSYSSTTTNITTIYPHNLLSYNNKPKSFPQSHRILQEHPSEFILSFTVIRSENNVLRSKVCIGSPERCGMFKLSTISSIMWTFTSPNDVSSPLYNPKHSNTSKNLRTSIQLSENAQHIEADLYEDSISIDNYLIGRLSFAIIPTTSKVYTDQYDGAIGLGYSNDQSIPSLLEHVDKQNLIDYNVYYINFYSTDKATLTIGNFPYDSYYMDHFMFKTCNVFKYKENSSININNRWECLLTAIYYRSFGKDYFHKVNTRISFNASSNLILVSDTFFDVFVNEYFGNFISTNQCTVERSYDAYSSVQCKEETNYKLLPKIKFMIGKWSVSFTYDDIMRKTEYNTVECVIKKHNTLNTFIFGYPLFKKYIVIFDKMSSRIGLIRNNKRGNNK